jgi:hypothetical protein
MAIASLSTEEVIIHEAIENKTSIFRSDVVTRESLLYFLNNKLPRGISVHSSRIKHIVRDNLESLPLLTGERRGRQIQVSGIDSRSDSEILIKGGQTRQVIYSCRNHNLWAKAPTENLAVEYDKIFDSDGKATALKVVK